MPWKWPRARRLDLPETARRAKNYGAAFGKFHYFRRELVLMRLKSAADFPF
jgi:hypothetical protein